MSTLTINVQADRLPNIDADDGTGQVVSCAAVTLKVSAVVTGTGALPAGAKDELLQWKWRKATDPHLPWDAHDPDVWTFWSFDPAAGSFTLLDPGTVRFFRTVTVPADFDHDAHDAELNERFQRRIIDEIQTLETSGDPDAALRRPDPEAPTTSRTVFGLVESLSGLPFPVPAGMMTATAIRFSPPPDPAHLIVAAPRFASANGVAYALDLATLSARANLRADGATIECAAAAGATFERPTIEMRPSLPANELAPMAGDEQRLLDIEKMIVRVPEGRTGVEASDWVAALPRRIAETVDPYARLLAVFDDTISRALAEDDETPPPVGDMKVSLRRALELDLTRPPAAEPPPYRLLKAMDRIAWSVIGLRLIGLSAAPPPALMLLQAIAERNVSLANAVAERLMAMAAAPEPQDSGGRSGAFAAFAAARLARLVGVPTGALPAEVAAADRPEGFMPALVHHWTGVTEFRATVKDGMAFRLGARRAAVPKDAPAWPAPDGTELALSPEPLFDVSRLPRIAWRVALVSVPGRAFALDVGLAPGVPNAVARVAGQLVPGHVDLALTLQGAASPAQLAVPVGARALLTLELTTEKTGRRTLCAQLSANDASSEPVTADGAAFTRAPFSFLFTAGGADLELGFPVDEAPIALADELRHGATPQALRGELALAHAGPYLEGIVAGRVAWSGTGGQVATGTLGQRITAAIGALTAIGAVGSSLYTRLLDHALAHAGLPARDSADRGDGAVLRDLLVRLMTGAAAGAAVLARSLVPETADGMANGKIVDQARRLTADATPLVMRIDQIQTFDATEDLWSRIAGIGVLVARTRDKSEAPARWASLNVARLHVSQEDGRGGRKPLDKDNAVRVAGGPIEGRGALVDPVAQQVAEISGLRSALVSYDNRSLVAVMGEDQALATPDGTHAVARRVEAYGPPPQASDVRLPALSFGYVFHLCPYVIGQGGALPPWLRADATKPFERIVDAERINPPAEAWRQAIYRRTRGIGMPVLLPPHVLPGVPKGVVPLAGELAIRPPPVSIGRGVDGRFFVSEDGVSGLVDPAPVGAGELPGLRIDLGGIALVTAGDLKIVLHGRPAAGEEPKPLAELVVPSLVNDTHVRAEAFSDGWRYWIATGEPPWAEDEPAFLGPTTVADPNLSDLSQWRAIAVHVAVEQTTSVTLQPPLLTHVVKPGAAEIRTVGRPYIAPESSHTQRAVHVLDGIARGTKLDAGRDEFTLKIRRPSVDYGTDERWLNAALIERLGSTEDRKHIDKALAVAKRLSDEEDRKAGETRTLDDPAVNAIHVELVRIFPTFKPFGMCQVGDTFDILAQMTGFTSEGRPASRLDRHVRVEKTRKASEEGLSAAGPMPLARLLAGCCYELRIYGGVPPVQPKISLIETGKRLSQAVRGVMRGHASAQGEVRLGAPLVLTFEVATEEMPAHVFQGEDGESPMSIAVLRPPAAPVEVARIALERDFASRRYPALRYCSSVGLIPQRWSWRGRPQDDDWTDPVGPDRFAIAFADRRDDDIGMILTRRLERAHVYNGRARLQDLSDPLVVGPPLFEKGLDWRGGVALWRFGLRFESRYAAMRPDDAAFVSLAHRAEGKKPAWHPLAVLDRANGRMPKRPGFTLALPLTEPMMAPGAVPPLLLLFDEGFHASFHAGDDIEVAIEVARHPFTERERTEARGGALRMQIKALEEQIAADPPPEDLDDKKDALARARADLAGVVEKLEKLDSEPAHLANLKYWQEHGPDPIRSGGGSEGVLLPIRADGPIGYTFDAGTEAGRFDHTGFLVSPVRLGAPPAGREQAPTWPWSLIKLRCRRLEAPEGIDPNALLTATGPALSAPKCLLAPKPIQIANYATWRVANTQALLAAYPANALQEAVFATEHEGLVIDLAELQAVADASFKFAFAGEPEPKAGAEVIVRFVRAQSGATISFETGLGPAGSHMLTFRPDQKVQLRLVVSLRDKPQEGKAYRPAGDVSVRLRISSGDGIIQESADRWLSLAVIPLVSSHMQDWLAITEPVRVQITSEGSAAQALVRPVRLSAFTPSVWCQFAESMSVFKVSTVVDGVLQMRSDLVAHSELTATISENAGTPRMTLAFRPDAAKAGKLAGLHPLDDLARSQGEPDTAQVEEVLAVLVTCYVRDVFDRTRERPVAVKVLGAAMPAGLIVELADPDWPPKGHIVEDLGSAGRVRLLRLLRPKRREHGGFVEEPPVFPRDYFASSMLETPLELNPADARGLMLGMSRPIEWHQE